MDAFWDALPYVALVVGLVATLILLLWGAARIRRRGSGGLGGAMAAYGEVWAPTAHESHYELKSQDERKADSPTPDDSDDDSDDEPGDDPGDERVHAHVRTRR